MTRSATTCARRSSSRVHELRRSSPRPAATSNFDKPATGSAASVSRASKKTPTIADVNREIANGRSPFLARQDAVAAGMDPALLDGDAKDDADSTSPARTNAKAAPKSSGGSSTAGASAPISLPSSLFPGQPAPAPGGGGTRGSGGTTTPQASAPSSALDHDVDDDRDHHLDLDVDHAGQQHRAVHGHRRRRRGHVPPRLPAGRLRCGADRPPSRPTPS